MPELHQFFAQFFAQEMGPLLILSAILLTGILGAYLGKLIHIPGVTGNLLAGIIIGPACLDVFSGRDVVALLQPLSTFAMGLITVSIGSHLSYRRVHNALGRIICISFGEVFGAVVLVTLVSRFLGAPWPSAFVLGTIAAATAPATTMALIREMRAKGTFVKTLVSVVAVDNILCIMLFAFSGTLMADYYGGDGEGVGFAWAVAHMIWELVGSLVLALAIGYAAERLIHYPRAHNFSVIFVAILLSVGLSQYLGLSPLLTSLFFGVYLGNASEEAGRQAEALEPIELLLFSLFFTMAGASLHLDTIGKAGLLCAGYLAARFIGKALGACAGGYLSNTSRRIWLNTGLGLAPQAGVAIGLVVLLSGDSRIPEPMRLIISTTVLGAVAMNEILGPFFTRRALRQSKEIGKDRRRLIEFLQEEFILTNLRAKDKWEALSKVTDFYARTHHVHPAHRQELYQSIKAREEEFTTAVGLGAAIPHGRIEEGAGVRGVLAISKSGVDFDAPDGLPVQIIMLVVTPKGYEKEHLEVMASLAQMISDEAIRSRLIAAISANDAWEVIEGEDTRDYNYFLEEGTGSAETPVA